MDTANGNGVYTNGGIPNKLLDQEEFLLSTSVMMDTANGNGLYNNRGGMIPKNPLDPEEFNLLSTSAATIDSTANGNGLHNNGSGGMIPTNPLDPEEFRRQGHMVIDFLADYYKNIEKYPVRSQVEPGYLMKKLPDSAPNRPEPIEAILRDVTDHIIPGITHWQSPNHFAYFPSSGSTAGFLGEMLSAGFNAVCFDWMASPAATELEIIVTEWIGKLMKLPEEFLFAGGGGGVLLGTTCEAMLCTLTAARDKVLKRIGRHHIGRLVVYGSDQTHCAMQKAARIVGIRPENYRAVRALESDAFALSPDSLRRAITEDVAAGLVPLYLCATVGTTSSTAADPLAGLCSVAGEHGMWVHVDAAYAGAVCICPEFRRFFLDGVEGASSFSFNAHKWFLANLDCCCLWVKEPAALTEALSTDPEYLRSNGSGSRPVVSYKDWQVALSRRFRAMKMWLVLRSHGVANIRRLLRSHVRMAEVFEGLVSKDERFEVAAPRNFAMVCFRLKPRTVAADRLDELNRRLLEEVNTSGKLYMTHAVVGGLYVIRFAVGATLTEETHVRSAWEVIQECAGNVLE